MRQIVQNLKSGETILMEVPAPTAGTGEVLIKVHTSLVSLGTERMLVEFGQSNMLSKARQQPDKVKMVLDKMKSEGLVSTAKAILNKLDQPLPLGYSNAGEVIAIGEGVRNFKVGDRVVSNGPHAEYTSIPQNLVAKIPDGVSYKEASFTVVGAIALQGIRLIRPTLGETIVVFGLGLVGLITVELLLAQGCNVIGLDLDEEKLRIARSKGAKTISNQTDLVKEVKQITAGVDADGVVITASSNSNNIVSQSAKICRKRGRIVLVGVVGLNLIRDDFYEKELTFQVSCSYGPGRYDPEYEIKGNDYPLPYVRWTAKRNFEAVLQAISTKKLKVEDLISNEVQLQNYRNIYDKLDSSRAIAYLIEYDQSKAYKTIARATERKVSGKTKVCVGVIGAGNFTNAVILPQLIKTAARIKYLASGKGLNSTVQAAKFKIEFSTTNYKKVLEDEEVDLVIISTRHNLHAEQVVASLNQNKHVFVEKPLCLNQEELKTIIHAYSNASGSQLVVGFNRRFSPHVRKIKSVLKNINVPISFSATMNAGLVDESSWVHDPEIGGGRLLGEACHYIDLAIFLTESQVSAVCVNPIGTSPSINTDIASIFLKHQNGSISTINYFANGSTAYPKERLELHYNNRTIILDNFKTLRGYGEKQLKSTKTKLDKGHKLQFQELIKRTHLGGESLVPFSEIVNGTRASLAVLQSIKDGSWIKVEPY